MWLTNSGTAPLKAQVRVAAWHQSGGEDRLEATRELVASPAILEIAAGEQQLVRLVRPGARPPASEAAYRLTIDELPREAAQTDAGVQFLLRYSVPAFVLAPGNQPLSPSRRTAQASAPAPAAGAVRARLEAEGTEQTRLWVDNPGRQRLRLSNLAWVDGAGRRTVLSAGLLGYVLAGQSMQWTLPLPASARNGGGGLKARFNDDPNEQDLPLDTAGH